MTARWSLVALALTGLGTMSGGGAPANVQPSELAFTPRVPCDAERLVIADYFPPFPIVIGKYGPQGDYYEAQYLRPEGEHGRFAAGGGVMRERPLVPAGGVADPAAGLRIEVERAARIGIDGFEVDIMDLDGKTWAVAMGLLDAASAGGPKFRIAAEPDMAGLTKVTPEQLAKALQTFAAHPAAMRLGDGRLLVMPFAPERQPAAFWQELDRLMTRAGTPIALVPDFVAFRGQEALAPLSWRAAWWGGRDRYAGESQTTFATWARGAGYAGWFATAAPAGHAPQSAAGPRGRRQRRHALRLCRGREGRGQRDPPRHLERLQRRHRMGALVGHAPRLLRPCRLGHRQLQGRQAPPDRARRLCGVPPPPDLQSRRYQPGPAVEGAKSRAGDQRG